MIQFLRKLFGLGGQVPTDAPVDMHIVLDPQEETVPTEPKPAAKPKRKPAQKSSAPKKETEAKPAAKRRGRPKKG